MLFVMGTGMTGRRLFTWFLFAMPLIVMLIGFSLFYLHQDRPAVRPLPAKSSAINFGIVYLPITPTVASYYRLGTASGALVTEVIPGNLASRAGIQAGDIIFSFNGISIDANAPLLGMIQECHFSQNVTLEIWSQDGSRRVTIVPTP